MGRLLEGKWITEDLGTDAKGRYVRRATQFRDKEIDAMSASTVNGDCNQQKYKLIVGSPCGWSHRVLLVRALKRLETALPVIYTDPFMGNDGWTFYEHNKTGGKGGITAGELFWDCAAAGHEDPDKIIVEKIHQLYVLAKADYTGRASVPVLWDCQKGTIVNNESSDLIYILSEQNVEPHGGQDSIELVPPDLKGPIEAMIKANYMPINNGVYRCGFASSQEAYTEAATELFKRLDELEDLLGKQRFLCGPSQVTLADLCLFPTIFRFDAVYYTHFKCNKRHIYEYPNIWGWTREIYQLKGVAETCDLKKCCIHYYTSHESIHPRRYIPLGPDLDFDEPHGRGDVHYDVGTNESGSKKRKTVNL